MELRKWVSTPTSQVEILYNGSQEYLEPYLQYVQNNYIIIIILIIQSIKYILVSWKLEPCGQEKSFGFMECTMIANESLNIHLNSLWKCQK
jgi:hypothetical protein